MCSTYDRKKLLVLPIEPILDILAIKQIKYREEKPMTKLIIGIIAATLPVSAIANQSYHLLKSDLRISNFDFIAPIVADDSDVPAQAGLIYYEVGSGLKIINPSGIAENISGGSSNPVVTPATGVVKICSGYISNSGTPSVTRSDGSCAASVTDQGTGDAEVIFAGSTFASTPTCTATLVDNSSTGRVMKIKTVATGSVRVLTGTDSVGAADLDFMFICVGPK